MCCKFKKKAGTVKQYKKNDKLQFTQVTLHKRLFLYIIRNSLIILSTS